MNAMMIDTETLGLLPNSYVLQVGVAIADRHTGDRIYDELYPLSDKGQEKRLKDLDTINWWTQQNQKVSRTVFQPQELQRSPKEVFHILSELIQRYNIEEVWAGPAMFDLALLTSLWKGKPWHYHMERDLQTIKRIFDPRGELQPPPNEMLHNSKADACWQMDYLINLTKEHGL